MPTSSSLAIFGVVASYAKNVRIANRIGTSERERERHSWNPYSAKPELARIIDQKD